MAVYCCSRAPVFPTVYFSTRNADRNAECMASRVNRETVQRRLREFNSNLIESRKISRVLDYSVEIFN